MGKLIRKVSATMRMSQGGFTLVELLVVVGIIVALAATIVPAVARFATSGDEAARDQERENIQTAIDTHMVDDRLASVTANDEGSGERNFGSGGTLDLSNYLRTTQTAYFYCWDAGGLVTAQSTQSADQGEDGTGLCD